MRSRLRCSLRRLDDWIGRIGGWRRVLFETRSPLNLAVLRPLIDGLGGMARVDVRITHRGRPDMARALADEGLDELYLQPEDAEWTRVDLYVNADPWAPVRLRRTARRLNLFHGVAGKYDLDSPSRDPALFALYDRVAFANTDRMARYLASGIVTASQAALVGYPKLDALVNGAFDGTAIRRALGFEANRPTVIYAPTWSPASSLHVAGEGIIESLLALGCNVIAKLHDNCFLLGEKFAAGIDWRARLSRYRQSGRFALVEAPDATPYLAAADVMVTDHSSIGFEFLALDRPVVIFDAPDLVRVARINPQKVALLRSGADVATTADQAATLVGRALAAPAAHSETRQRIASEMFYRAGTATERAMALACELLDLETVTDDAREAAHTRPEMLSSSNV